MKELRERKRKLQEESDRLMNEGPKEQVSAFYEQVGRSFASNKKKKSSPSDFVTPTGTPFEKQLDKEASSGGSDNNEDEEDRDSDSENDPLNS
jgi:hypothetical protein